MVEGYQVGMTTKHINTDRSLCVTKLHAISELKTAQRKHISTLHALTAHIYDHNSGQGFFVLNLS